MLFPWYGIEFSSGLSQTGLDSFGLGQLALLLTVGAALYLIVRGAGGYELPRPLREGSLLAAGGSMGGASLVGYLMLDRPDEISGPRTSTCATGSSSPWGARSRFCSGACACAAPRIAERARAATTPERVKRGARPAPRFDMGGAPRGTYWRPRS